jgi:hypothetical protein
VGVEVGGVMVGIEEIGTGKVIEMGGDVVEEMIDST